MHEIIIDHLLQGYDLHMNTLRTISGLHHPDAQDRVELILMKRLPGLKRKGGNAYAKGQVSWETLRDPKAIELVLSDLRGKVDKHALINNKRR